MNLPLDAMKTKPILFIRDLRQLEDLKLKPYKLFYTVF